MKFFQSYVVAGLAAYGRQLTMTIFLHLLAIFTSADLPLLFYRVYGLYTISLIELATAINGIWTNRNPIVTFLLSILKHSVDFIRL